MVLDLGLVVVVVLVVLGLLDSCLTWSCDVIVVLGSCPCFLGLVVCTVIGASRTPCRADLHAHSSPSEPPEAVPGIACYSDNAIALPVTHNRGASEANRLHLFQRRHPLGASHSVRRRRKAGPGSASLRQSGGCGELPTWPVPSTLHKVGAVSSLSLRPNLSTRSHAADSTGRRHPATAPCTHFSTALSGTHSTAQGCSSCATRVSSKLPSSRRRTPGCGCRSGNTSAS